MRSDSSLPSANTPEADPDDAGGLQVGVDIHGGVPVLTLNGRLDRSTVHVLRRFLVRVLAVRMPPVFVVDTVSLTLVDDDGASSLTAAHRHARESGGRMLVARGETDNLADCWAIDATDVMPTLTAALNALSNGARRTH